MDGMHLDCAYHSWQSAMNSLGRKKKNWSALCHGRHAFNLSLCCLWQSAMNSLGRKKRNWAALCHGRHAFGLCMPFMAECYEEFGKEKLGSTLPWTVCIKIPHAIHDRVP